jgi:surface antigen
MERLNCAVVFSLALLAGCATQEQTGAVVGGATGAVAGSAVGCGTGRIVAIALGALIGSQVGANIGRHMDEQDRIQTAQAMEYGRTGEPRQWRNPDTGTAYTVTPVRTYNAPEGPCREFTMDADVDGRPSQVEGTACRQPDGTWRIVK